MKPVREHSVPRATADERGCWVCLRASSEGTDLTRACSCPQEVHIRCLARWQLQQAGRSEETQCRFCGDLLPDWTALTDVKGGEAGRKQYETFIKDTMGVGQDEEVRPSFSCQVPGSGEDVCLEGWGAYDAAVVCSSFAAAEHSAAASCCAAPAQPSAIVSASSSVLHSSAPHQQDGWEPRGGGARLLMACTSRVKGLWSKLDVLHTYLATRTREA